MSEWLEPPYSPVAVEDALMAFPGDVRHLMPEMKTIPEEFGMNSRNEWVTFQKRWFSEGLPETTEVDMGDGIDGSAAFRHLKCIQGSFQPKHEHKVAAVAYLASLWFNAIRYE